MMNNSHPSERPDVDQPAKNDRFSFRREAVEHAKRRLEGEVVIASPLPLNFFALAAAAMTLSFAGFLVFVRVPDVENVPGWIVPDTGLIRVTARDSGIVDSVDAQEDASLIAGGPIAKIRISASLAGGDSALTLAQGLHDENIADLAQETAAASRIGVERSTLAHARSAYDAEITQANERLALALRREATIHNKNQRIVALADRGFVSPAAVDDARTSDMTAEQDVSQSRAAILDLQRQMTQTQDQEAGLNSEMEVARAQAAQNRASIQQRMAAVSTQRVTLAVAPVSGRVVAVPVNVGQTVGVGTTIAIMTPSHSTLIAELFIPSKSSGLIAPGQRVNLKYQAFPFRIFGLTRATIIDVSKTVLAPTEVGSVTLSVTEPVFKVHARLDSFVLKAYGRVIPLRPGMLLNGDVILAHRSLIDWILDPLRAIGKSQ
ncbi:MAG: HlyD family efflux transporter periplasmic adaptor subunit [Caulobacteraceae bacterium]